MSTKPTKTCPHLNCLVYHPGGVCTCEMWRHCGECKKNEPKNQNGYFDTSKPDPLWNKPTPVSVEEVTEEFIDEYYRTRFGSDGVIECPVEELKGFITTIQHAEQQRLREYLEKRVCARTGAHTCRIGSIHVSEAEKVIIKKAINDLLANLK